MNYPATAKKAAAAIKRLGVAITLTRTTSPAYNPTTGLVGTATTTTVNAYGVLTGNQPDENMISGGLVRGGDTHIIVQSTSGFAPLPSDTVSVNGVTYTVIAVFSVAPGGIDILFNCWVRK